MDCSGFVCVMYKRVAGMNLPRTARQQHAVGLPVSAAGLRPGDLVFFRATPGGAVSHVGIYLGNSCFAHASSPRGVMFSALKEPHYRDSFCGARRVVGQ